MFYTYMIRCEDNSLYTGITTDISRRFNEHKEKSEKCAKYTYVHNVKMLECVWESESRTLASKLEYRIKKLNKAQKESLISNNDFFEKYTKLEKLNYKRLAI